MERQGTWGPPPGWIGGVLELPPFVARSATAAVGVRWAVAFPQGLAITVVSQGPAARPGWTAYGPGVSRPAWSVEDDDGGSRRLSIDLDLTWLSPLPSAGGIEIVVAWPQVGIDEARLRVDDLLLADALARARPITRDDG